MGSSLALEYRKLGLLPTCIGNERLRITVEGRVYYSRNTRECEAGRQFSDEWRLLGQLDAQAIAALMEELRDSGILESPPHAIDESAEGGKREELTLTIDQVQHHFTVQNVEAPEFRSAVHSLFGTVMALAPDAL